MINFSELLWKPQRRTATSRSQPVSEAPEEKEFVTELQAIASDEVHVSPDSRIALFSDPKSPAADRFRFLRMRLRELKALGKLKSLVISSPLPQDGKSTVTMNLATALAEKGKRPVLLIEADLYHPTVAQTLGLPKRAGLSECLEDRVDPFSLIRRVEPLGWYLLHAGVPHGNPTEILQTDVLPQLMQAFGQHFDWILIDTPPVAPLTDAVSISRHVDAAILVVRADQTPRKAIEGALELLGKKSILGIVFNGAAKLNKQYSQYTAYYPKA